MWQREVQGGVVQCGMVQCGMVQCGMVQCGMVHTLSPTDNLGKTGCTPNFFWGNFRYFRYFRYIRYSLLKLKNNALFTRWNLFGDFFMWFFL